MRTSEARRQSAALLLCACLLGCNRYVAIAPTELPRVAATPSPRWVHTVEGELVEIEGSFDVVVRTTGGDHEFSRPVAAWFAPGVLVVAGADRRPVSFRFQDIVSVELKQFSPGRTIALVAPITGAALLLLLLSAGAGH